MAFDTRELFARIIKCEAGGEGDAGMRAVASVDMQQKGYTHSCGPSGWNTSKNHLAFFA